VTRIGTFWARWSPGRAIFRRQHGPLLDALRRSNELLQGHDTPSAIGAWSDYYREEVAYIRQVNHRLLRRYDPAGVTDRKAR
jgi:hypothetical protein